MLNRPLHLCEVLEDEHIALFGDDWRVTASDVLDAAAIVESCRAALPQFHAPVFDEIEKKGEAAALAASLNELIEQRTPLHPEWHGDIDDLRERNRRIVESICGASLARGGEPGWEVRPSQVRDAGGLARQWRRLLEDEPPEWLCHSESKSAAQCRADAAKGLNELIHGSGVLTETLPQTQKHVAVGTRQLIAEADLEMLAPLERAYLNRRILDDLFSGYVQRGEEARLAKVYEVIHAAPDTSALCISGGGIRSATFGLGVLQGLARRNLLHRFDYLSTVSGGGYIGSWLSSWMRRHAEGPRGVAEELAKPPLDKLQPEPKPVEHLREFSNYLTPRLGMLSGDTLAVAAVYVRNLVLNWTILVPLLLAALALPRMVHSIYFSSLSRDLVTSLESLAAAIVGGSSVATLGFSQKYDDMVVAVATWIGERLVGLAALIDSGSGFFLIRWMRGIHLFDHTAAWIGGVSLLSAAIYLGWNRPTVNRFGALRVEEVRRKFLLLCLVPFIVACLALSAAWSRMSMRGVDAIPLGGFALFVAVPSAAGCLYLYRYLRATASDRRETIFAAIMPREKSIFENKIIREAIAVAAASTVAGVLVWLLAAYVFPHPYDAANVLQQRLPVSAFYVCFAVPMLLGVFFIAATVFVGVSSNVNEDYDREWWARSSGYALGAMVVWIVVTAVVIFGPLALHFAPRALGGIGGVAGAVSIFLGRSRKTGSKEANKTSKADIAAACAAPVFILFLLATGSLLTSKLFAPELPPDLHPDAAQMHQISVAQSQLPPLAAFFGLLFLLAGVAARSFNVNKFSMHSMYRNRLIRAYLGASRSTRDPHPFTGFDPQDNVAMHQLRPEMLWASSFRDLDAFIDWLTGKVKAGPDEEAKAGFSKRLRAKIDKLAPELFGHLDRPEFVSELFQVLNCVLEGDDLEKAERPGRRASLFNVKAYIAQRQQTAKQIALAIDSDPRRLRRNRELLDQMFSREIVPFDFPLLRRGDVADYAALAVLREPLVTGDGQPVAAPSGALAYVRRNLSEPARWAVRKCTSDNAHLAEALGTVLADLNRLMIEHDLTACTAFGEKSYPADYQRVRANRDVLDRELGRALHPRTSPRTMHVVNVALNLVSGEKLGWQERKAQSFTITPMHCGAFNLGYRNSVRYGGPSGISLGTAVTISGAAVSPNMGYHSSPPLAFLLTLFNVRLGWWLGNPGPHGGATWTQECPTLALAPLMAELFGATTDGFPYVYLSDGGHFENLGLYEMVLRRRRYIVVSDAGCDPSHAFEDLGNAIRKIRTDLGIPIEIEHMGLHPRPEAGDPKAGRYCAVGKIRYSCVDPGASDGDLLYIKPAVYMTEPKDVYNYAKLSNAFPHESTADQWFSESQFESYRMLGSHAIDRICTGKHDDCDATEAANWIPATWTDFFDKAREHAEKDLVRLPPEQRPPDPPATISLRA